MTAAALAIKVHSKSRQIPEGNAADPGSITVTEGSINNIIRYVYAYLEDAKYYKNQEKFETSLTSVAYCEGLLDALKLIGAINTSSST